MLILSRKVGEKVVVTDDVTNAVIVTITTLECRSGSVRYGFEAPDRYTILREELVEGQETQASRKSR